MAATFSKGKSVSCLDALAASGYVWGAVDGEAGAGGVAREEAFDAMGVMSLSLLARR